MSSQQPAEVAEEEQTGEWKLLWRLSQEPAHVVTQLLPTDQEGKTQGFLLEIDDKDENKEPETQVFG